MTNNIKNQYKRTILSTAQAYLDIQKEECDPLIEDIKYELMSLYPSMGEKELTDWAMEFINWEKLKDRKFIFKKLDCIFGKK